MRPAWACGLGVALLGVVVLVGWLLRMPELVSLSPVVIAMQPNTALAFVSAGVGLALAAAGWRLAAPVAALAGALGLATLVQASLGRDIGIDRLLIEPFLTQATEHPGRIAPNAALAFLLACGALALGGGQSRWRRAPLIVGAAGATVFGLGLVALVSYGMGIAPDHGWLGMVRMAPNTAAGLTMLGAGVVSLGCYRQRALESGVFPYWSPGLIGVGALIVTLFIWQVLDFQESLLVAQGVAPARSFVSGLVLAFGVALSAALAGALQLFMTARARTAELAEAYASLRHEVDRRAAAEMELLEALAFNQTIVRESTIGVGVYRKDGRCVAANDAHARIVGATTERMLDQNFRSLASWARSGLLEAALATLETGQPRVIETHVVSSFGRDTWIEARFIRFHQDSGPHLLLLANDVSEQRRLVEELRHTSEAAEAASRAKSQFVANMSHEIRTPLNAVVGLLYLMNQTTVTGRQADYLGKMGAAANALLALINDVLDYSKIEAARLEIEATPFRLGAILDSLADVANEGARRKDIELVFSVGPGVPDALIGDPLRLGQILLNVTSNAIKYTEAGEVVVSIERAAVAAPEGRVTLRFTVRDTGIGMTSDQRERLFSPFTQGDTSMSRKYGGSGLGLTISRQLVELMGGAIGLDSAPGRGTTCVFTLSFGQAAPVAAAAMDAARDIRSCRALVVDDLDTARDSLAGILAGLGLSATAVAGGAEALSELIRAGEAGERPYDVVLLDWKMPGMDGFATARGIKSDPRLKTAPVVIMVTAYGREQVLRKAGELGLEGFLVKPVTPSMMLDTLHGVLRIGGVRTRGVVAGDAPVGGRGLRGGRVLLVEDNIVNQQIAREILAGVGVAVEIAVNGAAAVARLQGAGAMDFDLVLMDLHMPVMDGLEATRLIRARPENRDLPIIAMTADAMVQDRQRCLDVGMNDHLGKPIDVDQLFLVLRRWIKVVPVTEAASAPVAVAIAPATVADGLPASLPGIDVARGLSRLLGRTDLYRRLLGDFATRHADDVGRIARALAEGDPGAAHAVAHALKGVAGNLGAKPVAEAAGALEAAIKAGEADRHEALLQALGPRLDEAVGGIRGFVEEEATAALGMC